jgi:hypothetical protein
MTWFRIHLCIPSGEGFNPSRCGLSCRHQVISILKDPKAKQADLVGAEFEKAGKTIWLVAGLIIKSLAFSPTLIIKSLALLELSWNIEKAGRTTGTAVSQAFPLPLAETSHESPPERFHSSFIWSEITRTSL